MTVMEALQAAVLYPVQPQHVQKALIDRGLSEQADYTARNKAFDLAHADLLMMIVTAPSISEGGFSISAPDKAAMQHMAESLYQKHGEPLPFKPAVKNASELW